MKTTRELLINEVHTQTVQFTRTRQINTEAESISAALNITRSLASRYLNELFKENKLIKTISRPVIYLEKEYLESFYHVSFEQSEFYELDEICEKIDSNSKNNYDFFSPIIGYDGSLSFSLSSIVSGVTYIPKGLPVFVYGEKGVGKKFIIKYVCEYACETDIVSSSEKIHFINAEMVRNELEMLVRNWQKNKDDFFVFNQVEQWSQEELRKIIDVVKNHVTKAKGCRAIFIYDRESIDDINDILNDSIPITVEIPNLDLRGVSEKERLIIRYLQEEEKNIGKKFKISTFLFDILVNHNYSANIDGLINVIKFVASSSLHMSPDNAEEIEINVVNFPDTLKESLCEDDFIKSKPTFVGLDYFIRDNEGIYIEEYISTMVENYADYCDGVKSLSVWEDDIIRNMNRYCDNTMQRYSRVRIQSDIYYLVAQKILDRIASKYGLYVPSNAPSIFSSIVFNATLQQKYLKSLIKTHKKNIERMKVSFLDMNSILYEASDSICSLIQANLGVKVDDISFLIIYSYILCYNNEIMRYKSIGFIIAHGDSTATSIANVVNKLIGSFVLDSFDMPMDTTTKDIAELLNHKLNMYYKDKDVVIMFDIGSLELLVDKVKSVANRTIIIVNNVSTGIALEIGYMLKNGMACKEIYNKLLDKDTKTKFKLINKRKKEKAIVFTSDVGEALVDRMMLLFKKSFPNESSIKIMSYDYYALANNRDNDDLFNEYDVLFVCGTSALDLKKITFVHLNDLISGEGKDNINHLLKPYLDEKSLEVFWRTLIRNFSLENIMGYLKILDAQSLLGSIEVAIIKLQDLTNYTFSNSAILSTYLHVSNLVERLVIKAYSNTDYGGVKFDKITCEQFKTAFSSVEKKYNIQFPDQEIYYICNNLLWGEPINFNQNGANTEQELTEEK